MVPATQTCAVYALEGKYTALILRRTSCVCAAISVQP